MGKGARKGRVERDKGSEGDQGCRGIEKGKRWVLEDPATLAVRGVLCYERRRGGKDRVAAQHD